MDKEVRNLLIVSGLAIVILWVVAKKSKKNDEVVSVEDKNSKYSAPKVADGTKQKEQENAVIGLQAMRDAINSGENKTELNKLSAMILKDNGIKVVISKKNGLLRAMNKSGKVIAEEEVK